MNTGSLRVFRALLIVIVVSLSAGVSWPSSADEEGSSSEYLESETQVFRTVGQDGVVEFNDYGIGEPLDVEPPTPARSSDLAIVRERQREISAVAQALASERTGRETERDQRRERLREERNALLAQQERDELAAIRAAEAAYYPFRYPNYSPYIRGGNIGFRRRRGAPRYVYAPGPDYPLQSPRRREQNERPAAPLKPTPILDLIP